MSKDASRMDAAGLDLRAAFCKEIAESAAILALTGFRRFRPGAIGRKGPQDFLTETDGAVERHLRERIMAAFPEDGFFGEETGGDLKNNVWVVDPIDGTANFARGIPHFCISIAFVRDGLTEIGAISVPAMGETYFARRGQGATRNGIAISAATTDSFDAACVELGWSTRVPQERYLETLTSILDRGANVRRAASGALGLAYVADGRSDAYLELHMNSWDCLAGLLLAEEAGARVSPVLEDGSIAEGGAVLAAVPALAEVLGDLSDIRLAQPEIVPHDLPRNVGT
jgi:myo-inositol-1(or 4)-monophosphatase